MIELTANDRAILWFTWQNRFVLESHYKAKFWPTTTVNAARMRIGALREAGYLRSTYADSMIPGVHHRNLFTITRKGNQALIREGILDPKYERDYPRAGTHQVTPAVYHDLTVVEIRIAFENTGADAEGWISDHELRLTRRQTGSGLRVPDGIFPFKARGAEGFGVLEYENRSYDRAKIAEVLAKLRSQRSQDYIFIVCRNSTRARLVRLAAVQTGVWADRPRHLFFGSAEDVTRAGFNGGFVDQAGNPF